eukprot:362446-Chlamydomonas_euryale.AAC.2
MITIIFMIENDEHYHHHLIFSQAGQHRSLAVVCFCPLFPFLFPFLVSVPCGLEDSTSAVLRTQVRTQFRALRIASRLVAQELCAPAQELCAPGYKARAYWKLQGACYPLQRKRLVLETGRPAGGVSLRPDIWSAPWNSG